MTRALTILLAATTTALMAGGAALGGVRAAAALRPAPTRAQPAIPKALDGHYWARAEIDGAPVHVLVDTGATAVALTPADARRLGLEPRRLAYTRRIATADGAVRAAPVTLDHVEVGGARVEQVSALVVEQGLSTSLLGMSYLGRLSGFSADQAGLTLRR